MKEIRIPVPLALLALLALAAAVSGAIATQLPEIRRYVKVRSMD